MLKKIIVLTGSLLLMSCQENDKTRLQDLLEKKDYVNAKVLVEERLGQAPQDAYYNGSMGYILSVECKSTNCPVNNPEQLKKIHYYLEKSTGLAKVDDVFFVDFYQQIMTNIIQTALMQDNLASAKLVLKEFVNKTNPRLSYVYKELYKDSLKELLNENFERSSLSLSLLQEFNFKLTDEQKEAIKMLILLESGAPMNKVKQELKNFNRLFIGKKLPNEFLVSFAPAVVEYSIEQNVDSVIDVLENSIMQRSTIFGENVAVLRQPENVDGYAKGIELISKSDTVIEHLSQLYGEDEGYFVTKLQNISLKLNGDNKDLWKEYVLNTLTLGDINKLYENIKIELLPSYIIVANNDQLLSYAADLLEKKSVTSILNEIVFREDSNKDAYTQKTIELVERALKVEISKNNLDGIFEYLNYVPSVKSKFKDQLNEKLNEYIDIAWKENDFKNLTKLIDLHRDLNEISDNSILLALFEDYLLAEDTKEFFKSTNIPELIEEKTDSDTLFEDASAKYSFVSDNLKNAEIQTTLFSTARKMDGLYTQAKLFSFFMATFSKDKIDDLIIDSVSSSLQKDDNKNLLDLVKLAGFLIKDTNRLPEKYIEKEIIPLFNTIEDITQTWSVATDRTREALVKYNPDIRNLIKVVENDKAGRKITAASFIGKIKSSEILPFVENYKNIYKGYVDQIRGFYIQDNSEKGPEIIKVEATDSLLKIKVDFISRLGRIENLDKYKLDRGEVISKEFTTYYNPVSSDVKLKSNFKSKELKVFTKTNKLLLDGAHLMLNKQKYRKVKSLFEFNKKYGVVSQITEKTQDNFHIMPEGSSFAITQEVSENVYGLEIHHPAMEKPIEVNAKYNPVTAEFVFNFDYFIKLFDKTFSAKAKCQLIDTKAYCAVQDKYWKRQEYSVILKALQVK